MRRRTLTIIAIVIMASCISAIVYASIYCYENPTAVTCQKVSNESYDDGEQPDGDCDAGDKYESRPDPDCNGIWYGTPAPNSVRTPSAKRTTSTAVNKGNNGTTKKFK